VVISKYYLKKNGNTNKNGSPYVLSEQDALKLDDEEVDELLGIV
jgi:hypothetical protein